LFSPKTLGFLF